MNAQPATLYPGESRRTIAKIETATLKVEEMAYAGGLCVARHCHDTANLLYIVAGAHWSGYSRGGDTCVPHTVRFLPAGEPHENYFPVESRCLNVELRPSMLDLAAEHGKTISSPGQVAGAFSAALGALLHRELCENDDDSLLDMEGVILRLLLLDGQDGTRRQKWIPKWLLQVREMLREEPNRRRNLTDLSVGIQSRSAANFINTLVARSATMCGGSALHGRNRFCHVGRWRLLRSRWSADSAIKAISQAHSADSPVCRRSVTVGSS